MWWLQTQSWSPLQGDTTNYDGQINLLHETNKQLARYNVAKVIVTCQDILKWESVNDLTTVHAVTCLGEGVGKNSFWLFLSVKKTNVAKWLKYARLFWWISHLCPFPLWNFSLRYANYSLCNCLFDLFSFLEHFEFILSSAMRDSSSWLGKFTNCGLPVAGQKLFPRLGRIESRLSCKCTTVPVSKPSRKRGVVVRSVVFTRTMIARWMVQLPPMPRCWVVSLDKMVCKGTGNV